MLVRNIFLGIILALFIFMFCDKREIYYASDYSIYFDIEVLKSVDNKTKKISNKKVCLRFDYFAERCGVTDIDGRIVFGVMASEMMYYRIYTIRIGRSEYTGSIGSKLRDYYKFRAWIYEFNNSEIVKWERITISV